MRLRRLISGRTSQSPTASGPFVLNYPAVDYFLLQGFGLVQIGEDSIVMITTLFDDVVLGIE